MKSNLEGPVNLGSNVDTLLTEVAEKIIGLTGSKSRIAYQKPLNFITQLALPDISLAKNKLGWYPLTSLDMGLAKTLEYTRANKELLINSLNNHNHE